jgi:hypothetical protein
MYPHNLIKMNHLQYTLFPMIQIIPQENPQSFWNIYYEKDLRIVSSINYFMQHLCPDALIIFDLNRLPATNMSCAKNQIKRIEYFTDNPNDLTHAIIQLVRKDPTIELLILHYFAQKIGLISKLLVSAGFEVIDERRKYPLLNGKGHRKKINNDMNQPVNRNCPECDSSNVAYMEGTFACLDCGLNFEG